MICLPNLQFESGLDLNVERQTYGLLRICAKGLHASRQATTTHLARPQPT